MVHKTKISFEKEAEKILESWSGSEQDLIKIASKQRKPMTSFSDVYHLAKLQIMKELKERKSDKNGS